MNYFLSKKQEQVSISPRFERVVVLHILKNMLKNVTIKPPLLLGIHGPSGEGKTFQCEQILKKLGVKRYLISGGQLDSPDSGEPAQLVRTTYLRAGEGIRRGESSLAVILINDIDTGLGSWGDQSIFTMNQQTVFGELMHLVDYPNSVEGRETERVPIIITGNDFTRLYKPLVRAGRMTAFEWIPTMEERAEIFAQIFPELSKQDCSRLLSELHRELGIDASNPERYLPVAFYSHLRTYLIDEDLWAEVEKGGANRLIDNLLKGNEPDFSAHIRYEHILKKGVELAISNQLVNHMRKPPL